MTASLHPRVIGAPLRGAAADHLEEKLEDLDVALRVRQRLAPCVEPVAAQQKRVRVRVSVERLADTRASRGMS